MECSWTANTTLRVQLGYNPMVVTGDPITLADNTFAPASPAPPPFENGQEVLLTLAAGVERSDPVAAVVAPIQIGGCGDLTLSSSTSTGKNN